GDWPPKIKKGHQPIGKPDETTRDQARPRKGRDGASRNGPAKRERRRMRTRGLRKERQGVVVSDRMQKTVVVSLERTVMHPKYKKFLKRRTKVKVHDEGQQCHVGDRVLIVESRPLSRDKRWRVSRIVERAKMIENEPAEKAGA